MNIFLWIVQGLLALHTLIGAVWKFSHSEPTLKAIPHGVCLAMGGLEIVCAVALILPALNKSLGVAAPVAAVCIAAEMLIFCAVNLSSGEINPGHQAYWLIVVAVCAFVAYGRFVLRPF